MGGGKSGGSSNQPTVTNVSTFNPAQEQMSQALSDYMLGAGVSTGQINPNWTRWNDAQSAYNDASDTNATFESLGFVDPMGLYDPGARPGVEPSKYIMSYPDSKLDKGATPYTGERIAGQTGLEVSAQDKLAQLMNGGNSPLINKASSTLEDLMVGTPEQALADYNKNILPQAQKNWNDTILPSTKEAFVGPGTYWGSERAAGVAKAGNDWATEQGVLASDYANKALDRSLSATSGATTLEQYLSNRNLDQVKTSNVMGMQERTVRQQKLDSLYGEFLRVQPEASPWLDKMLTFMGVKSVDSLATPGEESMGTQLMGLVGTIAGAMIAACWVASEIFGGWFEPRTVNARYYINHLAPSWFRNFYLRNGENIAKFIHNKPLLKLGLKPLFCLFAHKGKQFQILKMRYNVNLTTQ